MARPPAPSTDQLRLLAEAVTDYAIFVLDTDGNIRTWNEGARRIKGYERDEIVGRHFSTFYTAEDLARDHPAHELTVAAAEGRFEDEGWRVRKDGSRFWANVVITALRDEEGELLGFGKVTRDLTVRRLAEDQLRLRSIELAEANRELEELRLAVSSIRDYAIFLLDLHGYIRTWNDGAMQIKGYRPEEVIGQHFELFYTEEDRQRGHPAHELEVAAREGRFGEEGWRVRKDGSRFWASVNVTALRDDHGILVGYAKVTRDLSDSRAAQEAQREIAAELARSNAELERFASAAAHDLVEPLHTITGLSDLVRQRHADVLDETGLSALVHISNAAARLNARVDGLLEYSRATRRELRTEPVAVAEILDQVEAGLGVALDERHAVIARDGELGIVSADPHLLEVVLQNLVANALKFSEGDGPCITVSCMEDNANRRISVADHGIGISADQHERIFKIFSRLHPEERYPGTGMGLAMCQQIIERHGGEMGVDSTPGEGSRFWFTLPAA